MKIVQFFILLLLITSCSHQKAIINSKGNLVGISTKSDFETGDFKSWFEEEYSAYKPDSKVITALKPNTKDIKIKAFMGTWCGDSRREVPRFYKLLDVLNFNSTKFELIAVNSNKQTPDNLQKGFNITYVPTFIFYKNNKEIGRIVESPIESLEADFLKIISGKKYTPNYAE